MRRHKIVTYVNIILFSFYLKGKNPLQEHKFEVSDSTSYYPLQCTAKRNIKIKTTQRTSSFKH